jgi:hypothetical protein
MHLLEDLLAVGEQTRVFDSNGLSVVFCYLRED